MKLYLAAPLFTWGEREQNRQLAEELTALGYECFLPQAQEANVRAMSAHAIYMTDVRGVDWCDVIVACVDGPDPDSGTAWELGYALAKSKPAILYRTDFRSGGDFGGQPVNLMLTCGARGYVYFRGTHISDLADAIDYKLGGLVP